MADLDLGWIEDFLEVARQGNFTGAARARGIRQSTLSRRVQSLERWLGTDLLKRESRRLELTEQGQVFRDDAEKIVISLRDAKYNAEQAAPPRATRFYTLHTLSATFVPRVISAIRKSLHDDALNTKTSIIVGNISDCVEAIVHRTAPFMISYESEQNRILFTDDTLEALFPTDRPHIRQERIQSIRIAKDRLIPVCPGGQRDHYEAMLRSGEPIPYSTYSPGTYLSDLVARKIEELELELHKKLRMVDDAQMADTLRNLVREGQGVAWVLLSTARRALDAGEIARFDFGLGQRTNIELNIKMFRSTDFSGPTIERIWSISQTLEQVLTPSDAI